VRCSKDGRLIDVALTISPIKDSFGRVTAASSIARDITGRKRAEQQILNLNCRLEETAAEAEAANRAKTTFLSTMSHEIRTPLNAILGYAQLMTRDPALSVETKANLKIVGRSGEHLVTLINDVLDMSKIEAGHRLHVILEPRTDDRLWLSVRVEDTGSGMTEAEQEKLFEPFRQAKSGLNTQEGTGLGLAISRQHARLMGGDVTVASTPGAGSIFRFEIPIARGDASVAVRRNSPRRVTGLKPGRKAPSVLVVDDQFENRDWLSKLLTAVGFSVREAENGEAAIRCWEEWRPELILMDVHMPVMDGLEATRRIKSDPREKDTVIVILTASAMDEDRRTVTQTQADQFLSKPCREEDVLEAVRLLLNLSYNYEEINEAANQPGNGLDALTADRLGRLPPELIEELLDATLSGNKRLLDERIVKVRDAEDARTAHALQELADNYDYEALAHLLEQACPR
jgi:CheY-like chemotaxis protein